MNVMLRELLSSMEPDADPRLRRAWATAVIHSNSGAVPATDMPAGRFFWNRGFLMLLLDRAGNPTHLCKVRPEGDERLHHEGRIMERLCADPELGSLLPPASWRAMPGVQVLVTAFAPGQPYGTRLRTLSPSAWGEDMAEVLALTTRLSQRAATLMPELLTELPLRNSGQSAAALEGMKAMGVEAGRLSRLEAIMSEVESLPPSLQHGDLWPANLLYDRGTWCLLDFEAFGHVRVPLFDAIHLLRTCMRDRAGHSAHRTWLNQLFSSGADAEVCRRALLNAAIREHIDAEQGVKCLAYYLIVFTHRCHLVHLPRRFIEPLLNEVRTMADLLESAPDKLYSLFLASGRRQGP